MKNYYQRHKEFCQHAGAAVFFLLLAVIVTWPLILHMRDRVPGWMISDNYEYLWKMWWFKHTLIDLHTNPLIAPNILYPQGFPLAFAEITPLHTIVGLPLTLLLGEITTYNLFALASFVFAGWAVYLLVFHWTGNYWAGLFSGILFALCPYHIARYGVILPLMSIEGLPVFLLGVELWLHSRKPGWIALAGLGYLLAAWSSIYYAFGLLLFGPLYLFVRLRGRKERISTRKTMIHLAALLVLVAVITIPLAMPYLSLGSTYKLTIPLQDTDFWSASPTDYLLPSGLNQICGTWVMRNALGIPGAYFGIALEFVIAAGFTAILFAFYAWKKYIGIEKKALLIMIAAALLLSFGTTLHIGRHPLVLPAPQAAVDFYNRAMEDIGKWLPAHESFAPLATSGITIPLPALFLRWLIPPLTGMRGWNRFAVFVSLGLALLAGLGFAAWLKSEVMPKSSRFKTGFAAIAFLALATFEFWPQPVPLQPVGPRPLDLWLAAQPDQGPIMILPLTSALSAREMLYTRYHGKPVAFAYGTYVAYWYRDQYPEMENCPEAQCLDRLRSWGVSYVILNLDDPSQGTDLEDRMDHSPGLERIIRIDNYVVYRLKYESED
jgi:hypothetical protein